MVQRLSLLSGALAAGVVLCGTRVARAQCLDWSNGFSGPGTSSSVNALALFDDGGPLGAQLYIGGEFLSAGGANARHLARWTGTSFIPIQGGVDAAVDALTVFDDASVSGPALFVGGDIHKAGNLVVNGIAKWNGASWYALGPGVTGRVLALAEYDDGSGSGPALYAAGAFAQAGGLAASNIARWDGASWSALGGGLDGPVNALAVYDEGSGPRLFAGGQFAHAGAVAAHNCARWDGSTWSAVGGGGNDGTNAPARALARYDDPATGSSLLIVGGAFTSAGGTSAARVASWDGAQWSALGAGMNGSVNALCVGDDGDGLAVIAGGAFGSSGAQLVNGIARWDGTRWSAFDTGVSGESARDVRALASFDAGLGEPLLYAGGSFSRAGGASALNVARWSTTGWSALKTGAGPSAAVDALALFDDPFGGGTKLYAAGHFLNAGATFANHVARWNGTQWSVLNGGVNGSVAALVRYDDGVSGGPGLYAGGEFTTADVFAANNIARWDGANWSPLGAGIDNAQGAPSVHALAVAPSASGAFPELYVGGEFTHAGGLAAHGIARWNGLAWSALDASVGGSVDALLAFEDGVSGVPWLYVGGQLTLAGGASASIARYDGASWSLPGSGLDGRVFALARYDDGLGSGPVLIAAGEFSHAGATSVHNIARWDGASWSALGPGLDGVVSSLCVFDDGDGDGAALFAGLRSHGAGASDELLFKWNGASWNATGHGFSAELQPASVHALLVIDQGGPNGSDLYVGGAFSLVGQRPSKSIAQWVGCAEPGTPLCAADGSDPIVGMSCPCQNHGIGMRGCAHSSSVAGARLGATGTTGWDPFTLTDQLEFRVSGLPGAANGLAVFFQGDALFASAVPFGDGVRCVGGHLIRLATKLTEAGACHYPDPGEHSISNRGGVSTSSGLTRYYQVWYSDPIASFCSAQAYNATNAYEIVW